MLALSLCVCDSWRVLVEWSAPAQGCALHYPSSRRAGNQCQSGIQPAVMVDATWCQQAPGVLRYSVLFGFMALWGGGAWQHGVL